MSVKNHIWFMLIDKDDTSISQWHFDNICTIWEDDKLRSCSNSKQKTADKRDGTEVTTSTSSWRNTTLLILRNSLQGFFNQWLPGPQLKRKRNIESLMNSDGKSYIATAYRCLFFFVSLSPAVLWSSRKENYWTSSFLMNFIWYYHNFLSFKQLRIYILFL